MLKKRIRQHAYLDAATMVAGQDQTGEGTWKLVQVQSAFTDLQSRVACSRTDGIIASELCSSGKEA